MYNMLLATFGEFYSSILFVNWQFYKLVLGLANFSVIINYLKG